MSQTGTSMPIKLPEWITGRSFVPWAMPKGRVAFLSVFAFSHRSEEIWRAGRLMSLNSETVEHGETFRVEGAAMPQGFRVVSKGGPAIASAATLTSNSLWAR
jgi:hypothetical protein